MHPPAIHRIPRKILLACLVAAMTFTATIPFVAAAPDSGEKTRFIVGLAAMDDSHRPGQDFHGGRIVGANEVIRFIVVETSASNEFLHAVRARPDTRYVEEDKVMNFLTGEPAGRRSVAAPDDVHVLFSPNDPKYSTQHGPQQIRADLAWDTTLGDTDAAVCIIDTGVRYTHEDLAARWQGGHDYINNDADPMDDNGHGTHVAGSAAARINNGLGIAGVANVDLYGVKALDASGFGSWSSVANAITWCADNTIARTVISMSLGGSGGAQVVQDAVTYAYTTKGKLLVAAAGNGGCSNCIEYPGAYSEVVAVTSLQKTDAVCAASSTGPEAELSGPGHDVESTWYTSNTAYFVETGCWTSMATPHASGTAALVWSQHTSLTAAQLRQRLRDTAKDLGTAGHDNTFGYGKVDAKCAMDNTVPCSGAGGGTTLYSENFNSGSASGWTLSGLWHTTSCRSSSPSFSLGYNKAGCPTNFDTGVTNSGDAVTPSIVIPSGSTDVKLNYQSWHSTESGTSFDQKTVSVSTNGGSTWTQLHQEDGTQSVWNTRNLDLTAYAGQTVKLRFRFDTIDSVANGGEGWYVDDVVVSATTPTTGLPYNQNFDSGTAPNWALSGLWHTTSCRSSSPSFSLGYNKVGCPTNFDTGAANNGNAITPALSLPAGSTPIKLRWSSWHSTESGTSFDRKIVYITTNDGVTWTQLHQEDGTQSTWNAREIDITSYAGSTVKVRFHFDSIDSIANGGEGWYVDTVSVQQSTATAPSAPQGLTATAGPSAGQIRLTWSAPASDGGSPITGYKVYRATSCSGTFSHIATVSSATLTYTDGGLGNGAFRCYKVSATNAVGEGPQSTTASATTWSPPSAPQNPSATPGPGLQQITVAWSPPASNGGTAVTGYRVYRSSNGGASFALVATVGGTSYVDSGLTLLSTYHYRVSALNAAGEGAFSGTVCAKPYPSPGGC